MNRTLPFVVPVVPIVVVAVVLVVTVDVEFYEHGNKYLETEFLIPAVAVPVVGECRGDDHEDHG